MHFLCFSWFCSNRESTSKPATWSAPSTAQPIHHGPWTTARLPCRFLPGSSHSLNLTRVTRVCHVIHIVTRFSDTFLASSQPQVYGYDDLQMLQTRIPLVSFVLWKVFNCGTKNILHKSYFIASWPIKDIFLSAGLLQHPFCNTHNSTDWQRGQPDKQPLLWWAIL